MAIAISELRPEIRTLVEYKSEEYNPNGNKYIDDGEELSRLLSEYGCKEEDLVSKENPKKIMLTFDEKELVKSNDGQKVGATLGASFGLAGGLAATNLFKLKNIAGFGVFAAAIGLGLGIGAIYDVFAKKGNIEALKQKQASHVKEVDDVDY